MTTFIYNNKEYDNVWYTSDEHYGSDRHVTLSNRLEFMPQFKQFKLKQKLAKDKSLPTRMKRIILNSTYGKGIDPKNEMSNTLVVKHNSVVGVNDIVFHIGDFGNFEYSKDLNGDHILILGNYEEDELKNKYNNDFNSYKEYIINTYNFIDVHKNYEIILNKDCPFLDNVLKNEIHTLYLYHKPSECIYDNKDGTAKALCMQRPDGSDVYFMNLFGHIHEKCKVKRFGLNVGVDANHYYPVATETVAFYLRAILHHYDINVFM